ncbi:C40 family peptidase [Deinococcus radiophilus]|uniref:Peptidase n=1 Tax=Deinococcus radiophilus TaxID=32062 RepID=A0A3S0IPM9_9DEIO|nr:C40 family peptidase [Deinococcus radiophilus]RTR28712.1 peptidase [Deinococcus radiophilus]UFA51135.1 C40 family peptidase [Deinococcus radiophilus]
MLQAARQTWLRRDPQAQSETVSEVLLGEPLDLLAEQGEWAQVQLIADGYQGWIQSECIQSAVLGDWQTVTALRGHIYQAPSVAAPVLGRLSQGARVILSGERTEEDARVWERLAWPGGWIQRCVFRSLPPTLAELGVEFVGTPYRWGGRSAWGIDCSGLMQVLHAAYGLQLPRDSGDQRRALAQVETPRAGDLAFFPGHVGLMLDAKRMLNSTSYHMAVQIDTLGEEGGEYGRLLARDLLGFGRPDWRRT